MIPREGSMTDPAAVLRDLAHAKAVFQMRAISAALGFPPSLTGTVVIDTASDAGSWDRHIRLTGYLNHSINNPPHLIPDEVSKASNRAGVVNHHGSASK